MSAREDAAPLSSAHDFEQAKRFLEALDPTATKFTFAFFSDDNPKPPRTLHATLNEAWPTIIALNQPGKGYGVFVTINKTDSRGRTAANIVRPRSVFIDADSPDSYAGAVAIIREAAVKPSMLVKSSPGRMHAYWLADDLPLDEFKPLQKALAERFGSDPMVVDLPRVMRLPGTLHLKGAPQLVRLLVGERCRRYMVADIVKGLGLDKAEGAQITSGSNGIFERGAPDNVVRLHRRYSGDALEHDSELAAGIEWGWFDALDDDGKDEALRQMLQACADLSLGGRAEWIRVLMAARASGAPNAEELAREWSRPYPGYSEAEFVKDWDSFGRSARLNGITVGSLVKEATLRGFDSSPWREKADRLRATQRASVGPTHSSVADGDLTKWDRTAGGAIKSTYKNAMLAVTRLGVVARRDVFADRILLANAPGSKVLATDHVGQLTDNTLAFLRRKVQIEFGFDCGADHLNAAIVSLAEESRFNPLTDWLDRLVWDGVERLKSWLPVVAGAADTELHRYAGALLVRAMIVRTL